MRRSLYKHAFGTPAKKENCYENFKVSAKPETLIKGNCTFFACPWDASNGSTLAIFPHTKTGRIDPRNPFHLIRGHGGPILDYDFDPFDDHIVATACEDTRLRIFEIPEGGLTADIEQPLLSLSGHERKVHLVSYHPTAKNVIMSASQDNTIRLWDVASASEKVNISSAHTDQIFSAAWDYDGSRIASTARDLQLRILDARSGSVAASVECHESNKPTRVVWLGNKNRLFTTGFNKRGERQFAIWDVANLSAPMHVETLELSPAQLQPFYDEDTGVMFLAGKGEAGIRYYEMIDEAPWNFFLSEFKAATPQRGLCVLPKRICDVRTCEIDRFLKLTKDAVEPVAFTVPRKSEVFQTDIFPETRSNVPSLTSDEYFSGTTRAPTLISLKPDGVAALSAPTAAVQRLSNANIGRPSNATSPTVTATSSATTSVPQQTMRKDATPEERAKALSLESARNAKAIADLEAKVNEITERTLPALKKQLAETDAKLAELTKN